MQKRLKTTLGVVASVAIVLASTQISLGDSIASKQATLSQLQSQSSAIDSQISQEQVKVNHIQTTVKTYESSIRSVQSAMATNQTQISQITTQLNQLTAHMEANQKQLSVDKSLLMEQLRATYEDGKVSYLSVLLHANNFDDLLSRIHALALITQENNQLMQGVETLQNQLAAQRVEHVKTMSSLQSKEQQLANLRNADTRLEDIQKSALQSVQSHIQTEQNQKTVLESQIHLTQAQIQTIEEQTKEATQLTQSSTYIAQTTASMPQLDTNSIVGYAEQFLGTPYVWGGTSPSGFDCSGFTQYVYAHFGVTINRTSEDQFAEGIPISQNDLQPGDLVFFSTYAPGATHVGVYAGNGLMVDAQDEGVSIAPLFGSYWGPKYLGARRFVNSTSN